MVPEEPYSHEEKSPKRQKSSEIETEKSPVEKQPQAKKQTSDNKIFMKFGKTCVLVDKNDKETIDHLKRQSRNHTPAMPLNNEHLWDHLESKRKHQPVNYRMLNEVGRGTSISPRESYSIDRNL